MGDPFDGNSVSPGLYPEGDEFSLDDLMRKTQARKAILQQEYSDRLNEANSIQNTLTPSQAFATSAIAFLPLLGGLAFGGKNRNAIAADAAKVGGVSALGYLGNLEQERKADKATAAAEASQKRMELDTVSRFETALPLEAFKQRQETERANIRAQYLAGGNDVPASQRLDPNDPLVQDLAKKTGQKAENINSVAKGHLALSSYRGSGAGLLPQDMTLRQGATVAAPEAADIRGARSTLKMLSADVPRLLDVMENSGQFIATYSNGTPEQKEQVGRDIQLAANVLMNLRAALRANPIFTGVLTDQDMALLERALPTAPGSNPIVAFQNFLKTSSEVERGRLKELYNDGVKRYRAQIDGRVDDPLLPSFISAVGGGQDQRAALLQEAQQLRQAIAAARGSPTPTPAPIPGGFK